MVERKTENQLAREIWAGIPNYPMSPKTIAVAKEGIYAFRLTKGKSIFGEMIYRVEVITVLRMMDEFCDKNTLMFKRLRDALDHLYYTRYKALQHYKQLERSINERG